MPLSRPPALSRRVQRFDKPGFRGEQHGASLTFFYGNRFFDDQHFFEFSLRPRADFFEHIDKRAGAAVHDGHFKGIDFHNGIVQPHAAKRRHQMLDGRNRIAVIANGCGQGRVANRLEVRRNRPGIRQILPDENNAGVRGSGIDLHIDLAARVQTDAGAEYFFF